MKLWYFSNWDHVNKNNNNLLSQFLFVIYVVKCKKISVRALHPAVGSSYKHPTLNAKFAIYDSIEILTTRPNPERFINIYANPEKLMKLDTYIMHCVAAQPCSYTKS